MVDETTIAEVLGRWSVAAPVVVETDRATGQPALDEVVQVLAGGTPAVVDVAPGLVAVAELLGGTAVGDAAAGGAEDVGGTAAGGAKNAGVGPDPAQRAAHLADLLAVATHAGVGFGSGLVPRCADVSQVWALLAGAVAAMTGGDVRAAIAAPDPAAIVGLSRSAREAIRDVVTCVLVPRGQAAAITTDLMTADRG